MTTNSTTLKRAELRRIFAGHKGSQASVARALGVSSVTVSHWIHGKLTSARIEEAMNRKAQQLIEEENTSATRS